MEHTENNRQELDLFVLIDDFLREAKRLLILGMILVLVGAVGLAGFQRMRYTPVYEATASFTVRVSNPLFSSVSSYNSTTAEQMAKTFPYILTSDVLRERIRPLSLPSNRLAAVLRDLTENSLSPGFSCWRVLMVRGIYFAS